MMLNELSFPGTQNLHAVLASRSHTAGYTHNFYLYPARFSPDLARTIILEFTRKGDWVLDPFMGGGTSIIEGLSLGRRMVGIDLNALACFVSSVRTSPLSRRDEASLLRWAESPGGATSGPTGMAPRLVENLPLVVRSFMSKALSGLGGLPFPRQRAFARCSLLRLGQWSTDCRDPSSQSPRRLAERLPKLVCEMLTGLREFVEACKNNGVYKNQIARQRLLLNRSSVGIDSEPALGAVRPRLILTSPPYPRVHVLYHRWQVGGRKETSAPYWIAQVSDGYFGSYYTGGSRTPSGERKYFSMILGVFSSVRKMIAPEGVLAQLVGFTDVKSQLPKYLDVMSDAGFDLLHPADGIRWWRDVPNRKWYATMKGATDSASEVLLIHRPRHPRQFKP